MAEVSQVQIGEVQEKTVKQQKRRARASDREALGRAIRAMRRSQNRTLRDVAGEAHVSVSLLSQVERGGIDPSLDSLRDISEALGTTPFRLLADGSTRSRVVRAGEGLRFALPGSGILYELLSPTLDGPFEVGKWTLQPGAAGAAEPRGHAGHEATFILRGSVRVEVGDETYELGAGDLISYDARIPHRVLAGGEEPAEGLFVISPPSF
jgi:transcriptional regulator with XRE-family HTH domain